MCPAGLFPLHLQTDMDRCRYIHTLFRVVILRVLLTLMGSRFDFPFPFNFLFDSPVYITHHFTKKKKKDKTQKDEVTCPSHIAICPTFYHKSFPHISEDG